MLTRLKELFLILCSITQSFSVTLFVFTTSINSSRIPNDWNVGIYGRWEGQALLNTYFEKQFFLDGIRSNISLAVVSLDSISINQIVPRSIGSSRSKFL